MEYGMKYTNRVRVDAHSVYVIASGNIYRPIFPKAYQEAYSDGTNLKVDTKVATVPTTDSPIVTVYSEDGHTEKWFSHGDSDGWKPTEYLTW
jgi:hypothetical protein